MVAQNSNREHVQGTAASLVATADTMDQLRCAMLEPYMARVAEQLGRLEGLRKQLLEGSRSRRLAANLHVQQYDHNLYMQHEQLHVLLSAFVSFAEGPLAAVTQMTEQEAVDFSRTKQLLARLPPYVPNPGPIPQVPSSDGLDRDSVRKMVQSQISVVQAAAQQAGIYSAAPTPAPAPLRNGAQAGGGTTPAPVQLPNGGQGAGARTPAPAPLRNGAQAGGGTTPAPVQLPNGGQGAGARTPAPAPLRNGAQAGGGTTPAPVQLPNGGQGAGARTPAPVQLLNSGQASAAVGDREPRPNGLLIGAQPDDVLFAGASVVAGGPYQGLGLEGHGSGLGLEGHGSGLGLEGHGAGLGLEGHGGGDGVEEDSSEEENGENSDGDGFEEHSGGQGVGEDSYVKGRGRYGNGEGWEGHGSGQGFGGYGNGEGVGGYGSGEGWEEHSGEGGGGYDNGQGLEYGSGDRLGYGSGDRLEVHGGEGVGDYEDYDGKAAVSKKRRQQAGTRMRRPAASQACAMHALALVAGLADAMTPLGSPAPHHQVQPVQFVHGTSHEELEARDDEGSGAGC